VAPRALALLLLLAAGPACDAGGALLAGARHFEEVDAATGLRLHGDGAILVQLRSEHAVERRVPAAVWLDSANGVPDAWRGEPRALVLLARDPADARRAAARLVRTGVARVAIVRGGIDAWLDASAVSIEIGSR
jgi:rhodanese-related sulfurtransferase